VPIYEYLCEACGTLTERMQKVTDPPPRSCPECGSRKIARMMSRTSFHLKGGGWYADLYASPRQGDAQAKKEEATSASVPPAAEGAPAKTEAPTPTAAAGASQGSAPRAGRPGRKSGRKGR